jgi:EmrB/QacA subfamily drug resistance transporter
MDGEEVMRTTARRSGSQRRERPSQRSLAAAVPPKGPEPAVERDPRRWIALAVVMLASFLGVLDFFIVNVSIPAIQEDLHASFAQVQLMVAVYGLTYAVLLITGGRLGDLYGRKRMFLLGVVGFTFASTLCGLAPSPELLIAARVLQGMTGAVMFPQVLSLIQVSFPPDERGRAFGIFGAVMGAASFLGNVLGGVLVEADLFGLGWRPIFLVNLPIGLAALVAARPLLHESRSPRARRLDLVGVAIASLGLFLLIYPLVQGREAGWPTWAFVCLAASVPTLAIFILWERRLEARGGSPLVELSLFHDRVFVSGLLTTLAFYGGLSAFFLTLTLFVQEGLGLTPQNTGLTFAPFAVGFLASSTLAVRVMPQLGRHTIQLGVSLMAVALAAVIALTHVHGADLHPLMLAPLLLLYGTGQGFVMPTLLATVLSGIPHHAAGSASGVLTTTQQVALAVGVAAIGSVFFASVGGLPEAQGFVTGIGTAFWCNLGLLAATFALVFLLPRHVTQTQAHAVEI